MSQLIDFTSFDSTHAKFDSHDYFLTHEQTKSWRQARPFAGLKILHNVPLYDNTLLKIEALLYAGADVTVSVPRNIPADPRTIEFIRRLGLKFVPFPKKLTETFDVVLDCSGDYIQFVEPKLGIIELTGTGSEFYRKRNNPYPVISVDDSRLKEFETFLGTGNGCWRGLQHWLPGDFAERKFVIFGFGKVGQGIAHYLHDKAKSIVIAETDPKKLK